jgi:hypothetical protein
MSFFSIFKRVKDWHRAVTFESEFRSIQDTARSERIALQVLVAGVLAVDSDHVPLIFKLIDTLKDRSRTLRVLSVAHSVRLLDKLRLSIAIDWATDGPGSQLAAFSVALISAASQLFQSARDGADLFRSAALADAASFVSPHVPAAWILLTELARAGCRLAQDTRDHANEGIRRCTVYLESGTCPANLRCAFEDGLQELRARARTPIPAAGRASVE